MPFLKFVKQAFQFRRKFLLKNLKSVVNKATLAALPGHLEQMGLTAKARAEELTPAQFVELFKKVRA
jgi:16S rRNA (adenine1518-N6/adenine1519-N6)-dimethyltransferase